MTAEHKGEKYPGMFVFVGSERSEMAKERNWSWQECQRTGVPKNCARRLWKALFNININPNEQTFFNLWDDGGDLIPLVPVILKAMSENGKIVVGMGEKVQEELKKLNIPHREMIHPAARGNNLRPGFYDQHVKEVLSV